MMAKFLWENIRSCQQEEKEALLKYQKGVGIGIFEWPDVSQVRLVEVRGGVKGHYGSP